MDKAVIYARTSTKEQTPELQLKDCEAYIQKRGFTQVKVFLEQASAWKSEGERPVFNEMLAYVKTPSNGVRYIVVWNMDRFSRQPEDIVLSQIKMLSLVHNVQVVAVNGDAWSELVEHIGGLQAMGFIGKALSEFLETVLRGFEHQRAYRESLLKSERIHLAMRKRQGKTVSYKGNVWGRRSLPKQTQERIIELYNGGMSMNLISKTVKTYQGDREKFVSLGVVHKTIQSFRTEKDGKVGDS